MGPFTERSLAKQLKVVDWLRAELVGGVAALLRAMVNGGEETMLDALATIVISAYLLGRRLGIPFARLDLRVAGRAQALAADHEIERSYGDLSALSQHLQPGGSHGR